jgi:hypothetical protein
MFLQAKITIKTSKLTLDDFALFYFSLFEKIFKFEIRLIFKNFIIQNRLFNLWGTAQE